MTRLFTTLLLLFATTYLIAQQPSFKGATLKSSFADSPELQYQFKEFDVYQVDVAAFDKYVKSKTDTMQLRLLLGDDYDWDIKLWPKDIRRPNYLRRWSTDDGIITMPPTENITFRGQIETPGGGSVSLTIDEELIRGFVKKDGEMYYIEPVWYFIEGQPKDLFVVYPVSQVQPRPDAKCGYSELLNKTEEYLGDDHDHHHEAGAIEKSGACKEVEIAIASDWLMFQHFGSAGAVEGFETGVLADVQTNYDDEFNDELFFYIVEFFTVTSSGGDPWTPSTNAGTLLNDFTNWGPGGFGATHDVAGLWTDRNFNGGTIGIAWLNGICNSQRYHCLQNFSGNGNLLRVLWAHELGHNFSATHDPGGSPTIMAPAVNNTNNWSGQSINQLNAYIPTRSCLTACGGALPPLPAFSANPTEGCAPLSVQFTDQSQFGPTSWNWTFPGGTPSTSTSPNPLVVYSDPGVFSVTLEVSNSAGSNILTQNALITVDDTPTPGFLFNQVGTIVIFTNTSVGANNYLWDFGDGNTSTDTDPVHTYAVEGYYDVTLTAFNDCGSESMFMNVPVFTPPTADFVGDPSSGCAPLSVSFTSLSSSNSQSWLWQTPGGSPSTSNQQNVVVNYASPGNYDVSLTVTNPAGNDTYSVDDYIFVATTPTAGFSFSVNGNTVTFTDQSDNSAGIGSLSYLWEFGDGNSSMEQNPVHTYSTNGTFDVILSVTNDCGISTVTQQVTILLPPVAAFSAPVTNGCAPFTVTFNNESSGNATAFEWSFPGGNPSSSIDEDPTVTYVDPGSYDVTLVAFNSAGSDTVTLTDYITVAPPATAGFTSVTNGLTTIFSNTSSNATSYNWDFGDNTSSTETNPTHTYADDGTYTVVLTATNDCSSDTISQTVVIVTAPTAGFSANTTSGCAALTVQFNNESSANAVSFEWDFPGGNPSNSTDENPTVTYNTAGTYTVTLTVSNSAGSNSVTQTDYIVVNTVPTAGFSSSLNGNTASFTNSSSNATSYSWDFGDNTSSTETNPTHTYADDGTYTVVLTATNDCGSVTTSQTVVIVTAPTAGFSANNTSGCAPLTVQFSNASSANAVSFNWDFPGGNPSSSTDENPTVTYDTPGSYDVTLTVTNAAGSDTLTQTGYVVVSGAPTPGFTVATNVFIATFTNTTANGTSYSWDFGDNTSSTESDPVHEYPGDGTYTVILTATNDCGTSLDTQLVVITSLPQAGFSAAETTGCGPFTVQFTDQSSSNTTSWEWDFPGGNPTSSTDQNPVVTYDNPGIYSVTLTASNSLGQNTVTQTDYINVITVPSAGFTSTTSLLTVDFTNNSTGATSYSWDFGDNTSSTETNPSHTYAADGTYEVVLTATNACGSVTSSQTVVIATPPTAGFSANANSGCAPFEVTFTNQSSANATSFAWSFPGGTPASSTEENPTVTYAAAGIYDVTLTVSNSAGEDEIVESGYVTVGAPPVANFSANVDGLTVSFTNNSSNPPNSGDVTYSWDFGDGNTSTEESPEHTYTDEGSYDITLMVTNDCGTRTFNGQISVVSMPTAGFSAQTTAGCAPFEVQFINESSANATGFNWQFPGGVPATSTEESPVVTYNTPGTYDVILTVTNSAGSDMVMLSDYVVVNGAPATDFTFVIGGADVSFDSQVDNFTSLAWDFGDNTTSTEPDPTHTYAADGIYTVTLTATNECGSTVVSDVVVIATTGPISAFSAPATNGCAPFTVTFQNLSSANAETFEWTFEGGDPATSTEENPTVVYNNPGSFDVSLIATNGLGSDEFEILDYIVVTNEPEAGFSSDDNFLTVSFTNSSTNATSFEWDFGDGNTSSEENPVHVYDEAGAYEVTLRATNECGTTTIMQTVTVMANAVGEIPGISEFNVYPNPNDGRFTLVLRGEGRADLQVTFTNVLGQVLLQSELDFRSGTVVREFSFNDLSSGMYILQVKSGSKALYRKMVID